MVTVVYRSKEYQTLVARGWKMVSLSTTWMAELEMPEPKKRRAL
jgi:hypothetical protein